MFRWFGWFLYTIHTIFRSAIFGDTVLFNGHWHVEKFPSNFARFHFKNTPFLHPKQFFSEILSTLLSCLVTCVYVNPQCRAPRAGVCVRNGRADKHRWGRLLLANFANSAAGTQPERPVRPSCIRLGREAQLRVEIKRWIFWPYMGGPS